VVVTRTGRRFFDDAAAEGELLAILGRAMDRSGFWERFSTDWVVLDTELMPWSAKAQGLIREQYAAVSAAAAGALPEAVAAAGQAAARGLDVAPLVERFGTRASLVEQYTAAWQRYCWPVQSVSDLRLAPFHVLATQGAVHVDKDHR